jgi:hypothetical protein
MKYLLLIAAISFTGLSALRSNEPGNPEDDGVEYLFDKMGDVQVSGFGGFFTKFSAVEGAFAVFNGGGGAVLLNQTFFIGGSGSGLSSKISRNDHPFDSEMYLGLGYGGLWLGYIHDSHKLLHWGFSTKVCGGAAYLEDDFHVGENATGEDIIFVLEPQLEVELNVVKWFKINTGLGYRLVAGVDDKTYTSEATGKERQYYTSQDLSAPEFSISLLFGGFKR